MPSGTPLTIRFTTNVIQPTMKSGSKKPKANTSAITSTIGFDLTYLVTAALKPLNLNFILLDLIS